MPRYEVIGRGAKSSRARKRSYWADDEINARALAERDGTIVETIVKLPPPPPSEGQLAYAATVGVTPPDNVTVEELFDLIDFKRYRDKPATERHKAFAKLYGVKFSKYIGKKSLFARIYIELNKPGREKELLAWFTFRVYREITNASDSAPIKWPDNPAIMNIADELAIDPKVVESAKRYNGADLIWFGQFTGNDGSIYQGGSNRTVAYRSASTKIRERLKISNGNGAQRKRDATTSDNDK